MNDNLKQMNLDTLKPFFPEPVAVRDARTALDEDLVLTRRSDKRQMLNLTQEANASRCLGRLPDPGETYHIIAKGNFPAWAMVPAIHRLAGIPVQRLHIATLGFSRDNAEHMLRMLDAGDIKSVCLVISCYFRSNDRDLVDWMANEMATRGQPMAAIRSHAKILALDFGTEALAISIESSANLRSCRNVENFTITNHHNLMRFHQDWMDTLVLKGNQR